MCARAGSARHEFEELVKVLRRDEREEVAEANREIMNIVKSLGGSGGRYRRERAKALRAVVSEVYSPPRVTAATKLLPELKLIPGFALDLTTADVDGRSWDFDDKEMRDRALAKVRSEKPMLLIGSPMCTAFSTGRGSTISFGILMSLLQNASGPFSILNSVSSFTVSR